MKRWGWAAVAGAVVGLGLPGFGLTRDPLVLPSPLVGGPAPDFMLEVMEPGEAGARARWRPPSELAGMAFHDLGWYEFLYLSLVMIPAFLWLDRKERRPGFWVAAFVLSYAPVRFALDFLRVGDARYLALTPAQWAVVTVLMGVGARWIDSGRLRLPLGSSPHE